MSDRDATIVMTELSEARRALLNAKTDKDSTDAVHTRAQNRVANLRAELTRIVAIDIDMDELNKTRDALGNRREVKQNVPLRS